MFLSAHDRARLGDFILRRGKWAGKQLHSDNWFTMARTPTKAQPGYGFMMYLLNTGSARQTARASYPRPSPASRSDPV